MPKNTGTDKLNRYFDEKISELTGIPETELTIHKIQALLESNDYPEILNPRSGGKVESNREFYTKEQIRTMRKENDQFLRKYRRSTQ